MHPNIIEMGPVVIHWYGLMLSLSFLLGVYLSIHRAKKRHIDEGIIVNLAIIIVLCAVIGSRFQYVVTHIDEFRGHWLDVINPVQSDGTIGIGGLSMLGGVLLSIIALIVYSRVVKTNFLIIGDVLAPAFALGIGLTRIGCFMVGCCFGKVCHHPWGVVFPSYSIPDSIPELAGQPIHPTQLYASIYGWIILATILFLDRKKHFPGFILAVFLMMYGVARFLIDFVRYYNDSLFALFGRVWTINQAISLAMVLVGLAMLIFLPKIGSGASLNKKQLQ